MVPTPSTAVEPEPDAAPGASPLPRALGVLSSSAGQAPKARREALQSLGPLVARVLLVYLVARALGLGSLVLAARQLRVRPDDAIVALDGLWYREIAQRGYPAVLTDPDPLLHPLIGFFPGYPALIRLFLPLGFIPAELLVTVASGAVAAVLIALIVRRRAGDRAALLAAGLWAVQPAAFALDHPYSEATFTALAAGCLLALLDRRWLLAGVLALLAGATRSTGWALVVACALAALPALRREPRALLAPLLAPLGTLAYWAYLWHLTGRPDAWFAAEQAGWHVHVDWGRSNLEWLTAQPQPMSAYTPYQLWLVPAVVGLVLLGLLLGLRDRLPVPLTAYCTVLLALAVITSGAYTSIPRFLVPAFPALFPYAVRLARWPAVAGAVWMASAVAMVAFGIIYFAIRAPGFAP